ncbi:MAG: protein phosphatase 2C domain-containing protein, partial [Anaerolineae bacterium]
MDCSACGADNREGARFCRNCGLALSESPSEATPPVPGPEVELSPAEVELVGDLETSPAPAPEGAPAGDAAPEEGPAEERDEPEDSETVVVDEATATDKETAPATEEAKLSQPTVLPAADEFLEEDFLTEEDLQEMSAELEAVTAVEDDQVPEPAPTPASAMAVPKEKTSEQDVLEQEEELETGMPVVEEEPVGFWRDDLEPLEPLEPQTVVAERFVIVEVLFAEADEIRYRTHDLERCWQCGYEENAPEDEFCGQCGVALDRGAEVDLVEVQAGRGVHSGDEPVVDRIVDAGRHFLILGEPEPEARSPLTSPCMRLLVGQRSDQGQVRDLDEDSLLSLTVAPTYESHTAPVLGLFAVADGMGGYEGGEVASKLAIQTLTDRVLRTLLLPELAGQMILEDDIVVRLRQATVAANDDVYLTRQKGGTEMGTTMTVALIRDDRLFLSHVGDCRAYRWNAQGLEQLTTDHSVVASMIAEGRAEPEEIYSHPHRSVIYRCIGDKPVVDVDTDVLPIVPGDRLILCCDGLWEMVRDEGI